MPGLFILEREDLTVLAVCINSNRQFWARESEATDSAQIWRVICVDASSTSHRVLPWGFTSPQVYQTHIRSISLSTPPGLASASSRSFWLQVSFFPYLLFGTVNLKHIPFSFEVSLLTCVYVYKYRHKQMLWKQRDVIFNKMYVCMYMIALGTITKLGPPLTSHHKLQTIASHNGCDCMDNVPLVGQK